MKTATVSYKERISRLIDDFPLPIDKHIIIDGRPPTSANSEFLTNKEQGDWAERLVVKSINSSSLGFVAVPYGRSESIAAGDPGFAGFYKAYQDELNSIGKRPDILLFRTEDAPGDISELEDPGCVGRAIAAIEVRSSSFLCQKYKSAMSKRIADAEKRCVELRDIIWISIFNVPHFYLQVFFDKAYMISFEKILSLCKDSSGEEKDFSIETDVKNQGKTTVKVNIDVGAPVIGKIDMPAHCSAMKELDRGRLLFYVKFDGGQGYLDIDAFRKVVDP